MSDILFFPRSPVISCLCAYNYRLNGVIFVVGLREVGEHVLECFIGVFAISVWSALCAAWLLEVSRTTLLMYCVSVCIAVMHFSENKIC